MMTRRTRRQLQSIFTYTNQPLHDAVQRIFPCAAAFLTPIFTSAFPLHIALAAQPSSTTSATSPHTSAASSQSPPSTPGVEATIKSHAIPIDEENLAALDPIFQSARVIGLGEATHGQDEVFRFKRVLTMHMVRNHGLRTIAYEATATSARITDDYINGRSESLNDAMRGLGMLIWRIEENAQLLRDLRAWNTAADPADRVRFIGVDVQNPKGAADRLAELIKDQDPAAVTRINEAADKVSAQAEAAVQALYSTGDPADFNRVAEFAKTVEEETTRLIEAGTLSKAAAAEARTRASEVRWGIEMFRTPGSRDKAMAQMLLDQLAPDERAVFWAHNGHVQRGPLRYLNSEELASGGHLAAALGDRYHALGVIFSAGEFHALTQDPAGAWKFKAYTVDADIQDQIPDLITEPFRKSALGPSVLPLHIDSAPADFAAWTTTPHPHIWFGGYRIPDDIKAYLTQNGAMQTAPRTDFDSLAYWPVTTSSVLYDTR